MSLLSFIEFFNLNFNLLLFPLPFYFSSFSYPDFILFSIHVYLSKLTLLSFCIESAKRAQSLFFIEVTLVNNSLWCTTLLFDICIYYNVLTTKRLVSLCYDNIVTPLPNCYVFNKNLFLNDYNDPRLVKFFFFLEV